MKNKLTFFVFIYSIAALAKSASAVTNYGSCTTPNGERALCIELAECQQLYQMVQSPNLSASGRNYLQRSQCGLYNNNVLVCCPASYYNAAQPAPPAQSNTNTRSGGAALLPKPPSCGRVLSSRIIGGTDTKIDEFPWMALIEYTKPNLQKNHYCGGTLINNRYVLTAAHCVVLRGVQSDYRLTGVRLGEWDTQQNPDCQYDSLNKADCAPEHIDIPVEQSIAHPNYNVALRNQYNDIALLRLSYTVSFSDFVRPICLPVDSTVRSANFLGVSMDVAGWGRTETSTKSTKKLKAAVTVWNLENCRQQFARVNISVGSTQLCAGGVEGTDSCSGDSGGPLVVERKVGSIVSYYLIGVISFGTTPCGLSNWPGVYTNVGSFIDWIQNTIRA